MSKSGGTVKKTHRGLKRLGAFLLAVALVVTGVSLEWVSVNTSAAGSFNVPSGTLTVGSTIAQRYTNYSTDPLSVSSAELYVGAPAETTISGTYTVYINSNGNPNSGPVAKTTTTFSDLTVSGITTIKKVEITGINSPAIGENETVYVVVNITGITPGPSVDFYTNPAQTDGYTYESGTWYRGADAMYLSMVSGTLADAEVSFPSPQTIYLAPGQNYSVAPTLTPNYVRNVTYTSNAEAVASASGNSSSVNINAYTTGSAIIKANAANGAKPATTNGELTVNVSKAAITDVPFTGFTITNTDVSGKVSFTGTAPTSYTTVVSGKNVGPATATISGTTSTYSSYRDTVAFNIVASPISNFATYITNSSNKGSFVIDTLRSQVSSGYFDIGTERYSIANGDFTATASYNAGKYDIVLTGLKNFNGTYTIQNYSPGRGSSRLEDVYTMDPHHTPIIIGTANMPTATASDFVSFFEKGSYTEIATPPHITVAYYEYIGGILTPMGSGAYPQTEGKYVIRATSTLYDGQIDAEILLVRNLSSSGAARLELDHDVWVYTGLEINPTPKVYLNPGGSETLLDPSNYNVSVTNNIDAGRGSGRVTITGKGTAEYPYIGSKTINFDIVPSIASSGEITVGARSAIANAANNFNSPYSTTYTGTQITPSISLNLDGSNLRQTSSADTTFTNGDFYVTYGANVSAGTNVGTATVVTSPYYGSQTQTATFTINPLVLTNSNATVRNEESAEYKAGMVFIPGRETFLPSYAVNGQYGYEVTGTTAGGGVGTLLENTDFMVTGYENADKAGIKTATVNFKGIGNYEGDFSVKYTIYETSLSEAAGYYIRGAQTPDQESIEDQTYTGRPIEPKIKVYDSQGNALIEDTDYKVSYDKNTDRTNNAEIIVTGIGNYSGTMKKTFRILPKDFLGILGGNISYTVAGLYPATGSKNTGNLTCDFTDTYRGSAIRPIVRIVEDDLGYTLVSGKDYEIAWPHPINATEMSGSTTIQITGKGNYTGVMNISYRIERKDIEGVSGINPHATAVDDDPDNVNILPANSASGLKLPVITDGARTLVLGTDYTLDYGAYDSTTAGEKIVKITGIGNYKGTYDWTLKVGKSVSELSYGFLDQRTSTKDSKGYVSWVGTQTLQYIGAAYPMIQIKDGGTELTTSTDVSVVLPTTFDAGNTVSYIINGTSSNYYGSVERKYTITPRVISSTDTYREDFKVTLNGVTNMIGSTWQMNVTGNTEPVEFKIEYDPLDREKGDSSKILTAPMDVTDSFTVSGDLDLRTEGTRTVTLSAKAGTNFSGSVQLSYTVSKVSLASTNASVTVDPISDQDWTGNPIKPTDVVVKYGGERLVKDVDYTLTYGTNTDEGTGSVIIAATLDGNYKDSRTVSFNIVKRAITDANLTVNTTSTSLSYTGKPQGPTITSVVFTGVSPSATLKTSDYTVTYAGTGVTDPATPPTNLGTDYEMVITGVGLYSGTKRIPFSIVPKSLADSDVSVSLEYPSMDYDGVNNKENPVIVTINNGAKTLLADDYTVNYTIDRGDMKGPGIVTVKVTGKGNYKDDYRGTITYNINANIATNCTITQIADGDILRIEGKGASKKVINTKYTGVNFDEAITIKLGSETLVKGRDYTVTPDNTGITNPRSTATITIKGAGVYSGSKEYNVVIHALMSDVDATFVGYQGMDSTTNTPIYDFTNSNIQPRVNLQYNGGNLNANDFELDYSNVTDKISAGLDKKIVVHGEKTGLSGLYEGDKDLLYHVLYNLGNAQISGVVDREFTGAEYRPVPVVKDPSGKVLSDLTPVPYTLTYSGADARLINVGEYRIDITPNTNYSYKSNYTTYNIGQKTLTNIEVRPGTSKVTYKGSEWKSPDITFDVWDNDKNAKVDDTNILNVEFRNNINAGTATIQVTLGGNYNGTARGEFTIEPKSLLNDATISVSIDPCEYAGGDYVMPRVFVRDSDRGVALSSSEIALEYHNNQDAGSASDPTAAPYVIITPMSSNYKDNRTEKFTISKLNINTGSLAGGAGSKVYNGALQKPDETGLRISVTTSSGNVVQLTEADLDVTCAGGRNVGSYPVTYSAKPGNKNVEGNLPGFFEITPKPLTEEFKVKSTADGSLVPSQAQIDFYKADVNNGLEVNNLSIWDEESTIGRNLTYGTDYTVEYLNNKSASNNMQIIVRGMGNYAQDPPLVKKFSYGTNITGDTKLTASAKGQDSFPYNGKSQEPDVNVFYGGAAMNPDDYKIGWNPDDTVNSGYKALQVTGSGKEYYGTKEFSSFYQITPVKNTSYIRITPVLPYVSGAYTAEYTGGRITPDVIVRDIQNDVVLDPSEYVLTWGDSTHDNTSVGYDSGSITASFNSSKNYQGSPVTTYFDIVSKDIPGGQLQIRYFPEEQEFYNGKPRTKDFIISDTSSGVPKTLTPSLDGRTGDYVVEYTDNVNPGTAVAVVKGINGYSFNTTVTYTIIADISNRRGMAKVNIPAGRAYQEYDPSQITLRLVGQTSNVDPANYTIEVRPASGDWATSTQAYVTIQGVGEYYTGTYEDLFDLDKGKDPGPDPGPPTPPDDPTNDLAVQNLDAAGTSRTTIGVVWSKKPTTYVDEYEIEYSDGVNTASVYVSNPANSTTLSGLDPATEYTISIRAYGLDGVPGDWSDSVIAATYGTTPTPPVPGGKDISTLATSSSIPDQSYTGSQIRPTGADITIMDGTYKLVPGTDFSVVASGYGPNVNVGTGAGKVKVRGRGSYTGELDIPFNIVNGSGPGPGPSGSKDINNTTVTLSTYSMPYTGTARKPSVLSVLDGSTRLNEVQHYTVSYENNISSGTGYVVLTGVSPYYGTKRIPFSITGGGGGGGGDVSTMTVTATPSGNTGASVSWTPVPGTSLYQITYNNGYGSQVQNVSGGITYTTLNGLTPGTTYTITVRAFSASSGTYTAQGYTRVVMGSGSGTGGGTTGGGTTGGGTTGGGTTGGGTSSGGTGTIVTPGVLNGVASYAGTNTISFVSQGGNIGYEIYRSTNSNSVGSRIAFTPRYPTPTTVNHQDNQNLRSGTTYYYRVRPFSLVNGSYVYGQYSAPVAVRAR